MEEKKMFFNEKISGFNTTWNNPETAYDVKNTLSLLSEEYIRSEEVAGEPQDDREVISFHLHLLNSLVSDIYDMFFNAE
jgi:hypothetical protein